jgi:hypothetical protein
MPLTYPHQNGVQAKILDAPEFDDILIVGGSWVPTPTAKNTELTSKGRVVHSGWVDPGESVTCQAIIKNEEGVTRTGFEMGEVLPTSDESPVLYEVKNFVPEGIDSGQAVVWTLTLRRSLGEGGLELTAP